MSIISSKKSYNVEIIITARRIASCCSVVSFSKIVFLILENGAPMKPLNSLNSFITFLTVFSLLPVYRAVALMTLKKRKHVSFISQFDLKKKIYPLRSYKVENRHKTAKRLKNEKKRFMEHVQKF